jgi:aldose 1-epimerase
VQTAQDSLTLTLLSPDGDQGYPGNLIVGVTYRLTDDNALVITYRGMSDKKTLLNMTNHTYFNLAGQAANTIYDHWVRIEADAFTEITDNLALTGRLFDVTGTPLDFREPKQLGQDIASTHEQMTLAGGFDHNYVLKPGGTAAAYCEETGISMTVRTDRPGVQLYSGNFIGDTLTLKGGRKSRNHRGLCLETQFFPDAINHPEFISPILEPGVPDVTETRFEFGTGKPEWKK